MKKTSPPTLATRLQQQQQKARYRRQRAIRQFAHRMRAAVILMCLLVVLIWYSLAILRLKWHIESPAWLVRGLFVLLWGYGASMPLLFAWRTGLKAYVLYEHWSWLALWLALPLDWYVIRFAYGRWSWLPIGTLALFGLGGLLRPWRRQRFDEEMQQRENTWDRLLPLGVLDLLSWTYWPRS